jgi:hypothetical protein
MPQKAIAVTPLKPLAPRVDPGVMSRASIRANNSREKAVGYYYGNLGDSIERRFDGNEGFGEGSMGTGSSYPAQGYGNFYGTGLGYGPWNRNGPWTPEVGQGPFKFMRKFSGHSAIPHSIIAACQMAYLGHGVVRNVIDLYTDFASEGMKIVHEDKTVQNFFDAWSKRVHLDERIQTMFMSYFTNGQVFIHRRWATLSDDDKNKLRRNQAKVIGDSLYYNRGGKDVKVEVSTAGNIDVLASKTPAGVAKADIDPNASLFEVKPNRIPWEYVTLNPLQMEVRGRKFRNENHWVIALDKEDLKDIGKQFNSAINIGGTQMNIPKELENRLSKYNGKGGGFVAEVKFKPDELTVVQDRKYDWWDWAIPFVYPALRALSFKDCLRNMEIRACQSVINSIFLFKLGNIEKGLPAEEEHFERLADMLQQPGQALNIIWNEAIEAEVITADVAKLFDPKKHESADRDILVSLGVPEALIGGSGGKFANSFVGAATLLERIETARMRLTEWLMQELKIVCDAMGFRKMPEVRWGKTSLRDQNAERNLIVQLYDRGILSMDYLLDEFDTSVEIEGARRKSEKTMIDDGTFKPRGPYIKALEEANLDSEIPQPQNDPLEIQKEANEMAAEAPQPKTANGRPPGSKEPGGRGPQKKPREPVGRSVVAALEQYEELNSFGASNLEAIEEHLNTKMLSLDRWKVKGVKHVKQLPLEERERLETLIFSVFSHMPVNAKSGATDEFIIDLLQSGASEGIKADVLATYQKKVARYVEKFGKDPSKEHRRQFIVSSWSQCAINFLV